MAVRKGLVLGTLMMLATMALAIVVLFAGYKNNTLTNIKLVSLKPNDVSAGNSIDFTTWNFCINIAGASSYCGDGGEFQQLKDTLSNLPAPYQEAAKALLEPAEAILNYYPTIRKAAQIILYVLIGFSAATSVLAIITFCQPRITSVLAALFALLTTLLAVAILIAVPVGYSKVKSDLGSATLTLKNGYWMLLGAAISSFLGTVLLIWNSVVVRRRKSYKY